MNFAGVDPGLHGAMALLDSQAKVLALGPTPTLEDDRGRDVYALRAIARTLVKWARAGPLHLTVEKLRGMPGTFGPKGAPIHTGFLANVARGEARGWLWMVAALQELELPISVEAVEPKVWQAELVKGLAPKATHKERSVLAAGLFFPGVDLRLSPRHKVAHDGKAEALLLAELGRRRRAGGALFAGAQRR